MENKKIKGATVTTQNGITFKSKFESRVYAILQEEGIPVEYESIRLELLPSFSYNGQLLRAVHYTPDLVGKGFILECKGYPNDRWGLKRKLIMYHLQVTEAPYTFYEVTSIKQLREIIPLLRVGLKEEWRPVVGYETLYEVSNLGNVRSIQFHGTSRIRQLRQSLSKGYKVVKLRDWNAGTAKTVKVHILVATAFLKNPEGKTQVDHIDANPSNNCVLNLRWVTPQENQNNPLTLTKLQTHLVNYNKSDAHREIARRTLSKPVKQLTKEGTLLATYSSMKEAAEAIGTTITCIKRVCDKKRKSHKNFMFEYYDPTGKNQVSGA